MITLPVVLIAAAVLLLLGLFLGLFLQRRRDAGAALPGPRTVADLVQQRADRDPAPVPAEPVVEEPADDVEEPADDVEEPADDVQEPADDVEEPADDAPADAVASTVDEPAVADATHAEPADVDEPPAPVSGPAPVIAARTVAPLGDDVPWRRAAQISGTADADPAPDPEPSDAGRVPALALLRRHSLRPLPADTRHPFLPSAPRLAVVPPAPSADGPEVAPGPVEASGAESSGPEPTDSEVAAAEVATAEQADAGRADAAAEPIVTEQVDADATAADPAAVVHHREIDVRGVADRPGHSHVDLVPVEGGSADPGRASDVPPEPVTDPVEPPAADPADQADPVDEPAEAAVAPDHTDIDPPTAPIAAVAAPAALAGAAALALTRDTPEPEPDDFPSTDPDVLFDSPPETPAADEPAPDVAAAAPAAAPPLTWATATPAPEAPATGAVAAPDVPGGSATVAPPAAPATARPAAEPARRAPRDPAHLAAEQAAADLALLRTFGDPSARPERAPIVALEGTTRPESPRPVGAAQPVRYRAVRRDGTEVAGAAVALLDDRGHEVGTGRSAAGELTAPHPGAYVLVATAPDHQPGAVALTVGDASVAADVLLVRSAALVGVVSGEDGPLAGARVTLVQDGEVVDVAETDADGAYLVADLASGEYAVSVAAAGCDADVVLVVVADETECVHDVELEPAGVPAG